MRKGSSSDHVKLPKPSQDGETKVVAISTGLPPLSLQELAPPPPPQALIVNRATIQPEAKEINQDISESLPAGIELHRLYRYQVPLAKDSCDLIVLKLNVPEELEYKLSEWRGAIQMRHPTTTIFIKRVVVEQNLQNFLLNEFRGIPLIDAAGIPTISTMIDRICGVEPAPLTQSRPRQVSREEKTVEIPFIGIDRPGTLDQEDLVHGERKPNGVLILRTAFIDITDEVRPGSERDRYAQKVGHTLYGRYRTISPIGSAFASDGASFRLGERRPAWIVECKIHENNATLETKVRRGWVKNHCDFDPSRPFDLERDKEIAKNILALKDITTYLEKRRTKRSPFIRIDGEGTAARILAETMIHSKRMLARWLTHRNPPAVMYRVHQKPSHNMISECVKDLTALKISASESTFETKGAFLEALTALERKGTHKAHVVANKILDLLLFRTKFSTENLGHFGLGGIEYLEIKPRAGGIPNQFILDALFTGSMPLSKDDVDKRANDLNEKRWSRDERMYKLRFLEMLAKKLKNTEQLFLAEVARIGSGPMYCQVESFHKWGVVPQPPSHPLVPGDIVAVQLKGFNPKEMRFEFTVVEY